MTTDASLTVAQRVLTAAVATSSASPSSPGTTGQTGRGTAAAGREAAVGGGLSGRDGSGGTGLPWQVANSVSGSRTTPKPAHLRGKRVRRFRMTQEGRAMTARHDVRTKDGRTIEVPDRPGQCGVWLAPGATMATVDVGHTPDGVAAARFGGLLRCSSIWACAMCSASIRNRRAVEVKEAAMAHLRAGGGLAMVTLTVRHHAGLALDPLWNTVAGAFRQLQSGAKTLADQAGIVGYVRAIEVTHGRHGWHPHVHALLFTETPWTGEDDAHAKMLVDGRTTVDALGRTRHLKGWWERWEGVTSQLASAAGLKPSEVQPLRAHGINLQAVGSAAISAYLTKTQEPDFDGSELDGSELVDWNEAREEGREAVRSANAMAMELARLDLKKSRALPGSDVKGTTPFEMLDHCATYTAAVAAGWVPDAASKARDDQRRAAWREYVAASKGRRAMTWGGDVRERYGLPELMTDLVASGSFDDVEGVQPVYFLSHAERLALVTGGSEWQALDAGEDEGGRGVAGVIAAALGVKRSELRCDQCETMVCHISGYDVRGMACRECRDRLWRVWQTRAPERLGSRWRDELDPQLPRLS
jgi:hypothetical protein